MENSVYQKKHELWLNILFASFAINDEAIKSRLYDFSQIAFRHMKWLGSALLESESGKEYNYDRDMVLLKRESNFAILKALQEEIEATQEQYPQTILGKRMKTDDTYLLQYISELLLDKQNDAVVTAFNMQRKWEDLDQSQIDALTLFLFEESYKEYELILVTQ